MISVVSFLFFYIIGVTTEHQHLREPKMRAQSRIAPTTPRSCTTKWREHRGCASEAGKVTKICSNYKDTPTRPRDFETLTMNSETVIPEVFDQELYLVDEIEEVDTQSM